MKIKNGLMLFCAALIWGTAFVAQSVAMDYIEPFTFNAARSVVACIVLLPCIAVIDKINSKNSPVQSNEGNGKGAKRVNKTLIIGGAACGVALFAASMLQQFGIKYTTVGKAGFITALYIVFVPILKLFLKQRVRLFVWISVVLAVVGFYFLSITDGFSIGKGDLLVLISAVIFAVHMLIIYHFSPKVDCVRMSWIQFAVIAVLSAICMFIFESPDIHMILKAWGTVLFAGALSSGVAYTLQILGQRGSDPTVASMICSLESVISVLAGWVLLNQKLSLREIMGCVTVGIAIVIAQLPEKKRVKSSE